MAQQAFPSFLQGALRPPQQEQPGGDTRSGIALGIGALLGGLGKFMKGEEAKKKEKEKREFETEQRREIAAEKRALEIELTKMKQKSDAAEKALDRVEKNKDRWRAEIKENQKVVENPLSSEGAIKTATERIVELKEMIRLSEGRKPAGKVSPPGVPPPGIQEPGVETGVPFLPQEPGVETGVPFLPQEVPIPPAGPDSNIIEFFATELRNETGDTPRRKWLNEEFFSYLREFPPEMQSEIQKAFDYFFQGGEYPPFGGPITPLAAFVPRGPFVPRGQVSPEQRRPKGMDDTTYQNFLILLNAEQTPNVKQALDNIRKQYGIR